MLLRALIGLAVPVLSGCDDKGAPAQVDTATASQVRESAERNIRSGLSSRDTRFRGVQVYAQALPGRWAVCGQVSPFAEDADIFVPFVSVVTLASKTGHAVERFEQQVGTTTTEANRVYIALVADCYENGGPASGPFQSITPLPPLPDTVTDPEHPITPARSPRARTSDGQTPARTPAAPSTLSAAEQALPPSAESPASGHVTMRQNANLHAAPHGPPVRVVPQGTDMHVFAQAPGGWYEVGDTAPWGWVHESMLDRH